MKKVFSIFFSLQNGGILRPIYFDAVLDGGVAERKYLWTLEYLSLSFFSICLSLSDFLFRNK